MYKVPTWQPYAATKPLCALVLVLLFFMLLVHAIQKSGTNWFELGVSLFSPLCWFTVYINLTGPRDVQISA